MSCGEDRRPIGIGRPKYSSLPATATAASPVSFTSKTSGSWEGRARSSAEGGGGSSHPPGEGLNRHLYERGLLNGHLSDVVLEAFGAQWRLHRVILSQAEFFNSLLDGGFEEQARSDTATSRTSQTDRQAIKLRFEASITRPAWEFCLGFLYGSSPELVAPPWALANVRGSAIPGCDEVDPGWLALCAGEAVHPATPTFLLSLFVTASYLGLPQLVRQVLQAVMDGITPYTLPDYLRFSLGEGIPGLGLSPESRESCEGLASIGVPVNVEVEALAWASSSHCGPYFYGPLANSIGEACACFLAKFGADIFSREATAPLTSHSFSGVVRDLIERKPWLARPPLRVWSYGGLSSRWVRGVLSSDALFLAPGSEDSTESARYALSKDVVELRRRQRRAAASAVVDGYVSDSTDFEELKTTASDLDDGDDEYEDEDEQEYDLLFSTGIYFSHMSFVSLSRLASDISPSTGRSYVPPHVLHRAHWEASLLNERLPLGSFPVPSSAPVSPTTSRQTMGGATPDSPPVVQQPPRLAEACSDLGLVNAASSDPQRSFLVPIDETVRINDLAGLLADDAWGGGVGVGEEARCRSSPCKSSASSSNAEAFFGIGRDSAGGAEGRLSVSFEPFRFSVEFWEISMLKEKQRLYSHTVKMAGSLWNAYIQIVRKRGTQLGIYLHRQSPYEAKPSPSRPSHLPPAPLAPDPLSPERADTRASVRAYFSLLCPSTTGVSLTKFRSGPDAFAVSQSWGYRSSMRGELDGPHAFKGEHSLRATVVMGVV